MAGKNKNPLLLLGLVSQLGLSMVIPILLCTFIGVFLDNLTGLSPLFLIVFIILGVGAAFRNLFMLANKEIKGDEGVKKGSYDDDKDEED
jgi:F0F1-type ATP synthase assembly protein I